MNLLLSHLLIIAKRPMMDSEETDDECIDDTPSTANKTDDECAIVPPPNQTSIMTKPTSKPIKVSDNKPDFKSLRPFFGWSLTDIIKKTFQLTTYKNANE